MEKDGNDETETDFTSASTSITNRESVICGAVSGLTSRFFVAPMDVVKIRQQLQTVSLEEAGSASYKAPVYRGMISSMVKIYKEEGLMSLWKGNVPAELLYLFYGSIQFTALHQANQVLNTYASSYIPPNLQQFIAGAVSGASATAITYPLDLLRTRFAAQGNAQNKVYRSFRHSIRVIYRDEGVLGFFRGLRPAMSQIVPYMGLFFMSYSALKSGITSVSDRLNVNTFGSSEAIAGMCAGVITKTGVFPLDVIRKRMQIQGPTRNLYVMKDVPTYPRSVVGCAAVIIRNEGIRGLYRGLWVSLVKAAPTSAITMWTFEHSVTALRWLDNKAKETF